jgi:hypothetical protein
VDPNPTMGPVNLLFFSESVHGFGYKKERALEEKIRALFK